MGLAFIVFAPLALVGALLARAASKPNTFRHERSIRIQAPPEKIFPFFNDFHNWAAWSPWERMDPTMKRTFSGAASGPGAVYGWTGNGKVGTGEMEIMESTPSRVSVKLHFIKPFEARSTAEFTMEPVGDATDVVWSMHGPNPFLFRVMGTVMNMEKAILKDFDDGLANLKAAAEG
jgi:hypothetical protein